ncbi:hypothetical protein BAUCODRAFT_33384 [Baudoinia panamericana UAMH 10762]|uniref:Cytochrome P450 n=1 Tax=Baudoinia panamericana (strain UAMH 10762) TaxID=717646 RepID=M2NFA1_BAUPA|nr:uncharacterized protein BAUCODRAFT_33384 [Baudoinia panamericana UAMH 10762]EMC97660.1 hypothetical protein BAUCODRAFT_33384 [Baudoinia panamericana UAMH 10762]
MEIIEANNVFPGWSTYVAKAAPLLAVLLIIVIVGLRTGKTRSSGDGPQEPPVISSTLPWIGHLLGMTWYGPSYYQQVNTQNYPMYTLPTLNSRTYIVTSPSLVAAVQRNTKTLSFYSVIVEVTRRMCAFDKDATKIIFHNMNQEHGRDGSLMAVVHDMMNAHLSPGPGLDEITSVQLQQMSIVLNDMAMEGAQTINLYAWMKHVLSVCNGYAVYGPDNIFATDPSLERDFWTFEEGMLGLVIDFLPSITARKAHLARMRVLKALIRYVREQRYRKASPLIRERIAINQSFGLSTEMIGHGELVLLFGILGNAVPSMFWMIAHIFSRPQLLQELRHEIESRLDLTSQVPVGGTQEETRTVILSAAQVKACPLLYSCYRETLRDISNASSPRLVLEDTLLADKYVLRKNSIVQIQGGVLHQDRTLWGEDAADFNPQRFVTPASGDFDSTQRTYATLPKGVPPTAFRAFGGGSTLCPGRHLAQAEIMTFVAALILGFDIESVDDDSLKLPMKDETSTRLAMMMPTSNVEARISRRKGWEKVCFEMTL